MKNKSQKTRKNPNRKHILIIASLAGFLLLFFGCNNSLNPPTGKVEKLRPQAVKIIQNALSDQDPRVRTKAIEVIAETGQTQFMPTVQQLLKDTSMPVVFNAVIAVGQTGYRPAEYPVRQLLKDTDENIRIAAAYALKKLGYAQNSDMLENALTANDQTVRANAAMLIGKIGDKSALDALYRVMKDNNSDDKVRFLAAEAIARLGDERILQDKLWAIAFSSYADDRIIAIIAMGALGSQKARDVLITKLDDDVLEVRLAAAEQLGALGDTSGEPEVLDILRKNTTNEMNENDLERVNILTALAIGSICTDELTAYLPPFLQNKSIFVRIAAAKAVFQCTNNNTKK